MTSRESRITDEIAAQVVPGVDRETLLASWDERACRRPAGRSLSTRPSCAAHAATDVDLTRQLLAARRSSGCSRCAPGRDATRTTTRRPRSRARSSGGFCCTPRRARRRANIADRGPRVDAERLGLEVAGSTGTPELSMVERERAARVRRPRRWTSTGRSRARLLSRRRVRAERRAAARVARRPAAMLRRRGSPRASTRSPARSSPTIRSSRPTRGRIDVPALGLVVKLDPKVTVPARDRTRA